MHLCGCLTFYGLHIWLTWGCLLQSSKLSASFPSVFQQQKLPNVSELLGHKHVADTALILTHAAQLVASPLF